MGSKNSRRRFLKHLTAGGTAAAIFPSIAIPEQSQPVAAHAVSSDPDRQPGHTFNGAYTGSYLNRVAFPIGGLGAGMFCLEGTGAISHVSVSNKPAVFNEPGMFAAISVKDIANGAKILEGPVPDWKKFGQRDAGNGSGGATTGLPHFRHATFLPRFPFAYLDISDTDLPLKVRVTGWSPFIPTEEDLSGLPAGALEYHFTNTTTKSIEAVFSFNAKNFLRVNAGSNAIRPIDNGFILHEAGTKDKPYPTDFAIFSNDPHTVVDHCWFRGGWWDPFTMAWNAVKNAAVRSVAPVDKDAPGASLYNSFLLAPGEEKTIRVMFAWYTPDSDQTYGTMGTRKDCNGDSGCCNSPGDLLLDKYDKDFSGKYYKPWYSSRFSTIHEVASYWKKEYDDLKKKSTLFKDAFFSSTLPPEVIEAIAANLTILKSPTVMRQYDGRLWNFEGCGDDNGCCHGSCTHVWNYAQAIPHLFPALERSLRHTEFCESQNAEGHQNFRSNLPIQPADHSFHSAADGQLGGIMKVYREWRIGGSQQWLEKMYPMVKASMDYSINTWDPRRQGVIEEPHHNTYDIEFWGPDGMHGSFYAGALAAIIAMGTFLGKPVADYKLLLKQCAAAMENNLFNGEYFVQHIKVEGLSAKNPTTAKSFGGDYSAEASALLETEGPKYQYGNGCLSDGVLGAWIARMCGLNDSIDPVKIKSHLTAVHKYNLFHNLAEHANPQRPAYALGEEGGLLLCTWPKGGKLSLPFVYSDEVWTGIEHQVASHLMLMGRVTEGLDIVRQSRKRYDGRIRNPFNEYECGHWYARALSSYGYLQALTGVRYDAVDKILYVDSRIGDFTSFISTETGFGTVTLRGREAILKVAYGHIPVSKTIAAGKTERV